MIYTLSLALAVEEILDGWDGWIVFLLVDEAKRTAERETGPGDLVYRWHDPEALRSMFLLRSNFEVVPIPQ